MLLSIDLKDAKKFPQGSVKLQLDWGKKMWTVGADQMAWPKVGFSNRGSFEVPWSGMMWIWDQPSGKPKANTMIVWDAPAGPMDKVGKTGEGRLFEPKEQKMKEGIFSWTIEAPSGVVAAAPAAAAQAKIRTDVVELIQKNFDPLGQVKEPPNCLESKAKKKTPGGATGCGGLPGWVISKLIEKGYKFAPDAVKVEWEESVPVPGQPPVAKGEKPLMMKVKKSDTVRVTSPTTAWENLAKAIEKRRIGLGTATAGSLFIPWKDGSSLRPKPGDIYLLRTSNGYFRHVGVVIKATEGDLLTADGGQGEGFAIAYRSRPFRQSDGNTNGEDKNPTFLKGWVDLEALVET